LQRLPEPTDADLVLPTGDVPTHRGALRIELCIAELARYQRRPRGRTDGAVLRLDRLLIRVIAALVVLVPEDVLDVELNPDGVHRGRADDPGAILVQRAAIYRVGVCEQRDRLIRLTRDAVVVDLHSFI